MKAIAKTRPGPGVEIVEAPEPAIRPGCVKVRVQAASVCGTDLHIYSWDSWASSRIAPPRIIGHEFCGEIVEIGPGVEDRAVGQFVASESHLVCGRCAQCLAGQAHVCVNTLILGVDVDGGFAEYVVIPAENARPTDPEIPKDIACFQDALGNAVHTAMDGLVEGQDILITGMGPIGLFAATVCRELGAAKVIGTEVSPYRIALANQVGLDYVINPEQEDAESLLQDIAPGGVDATLEMAGQPATLELAIRHTRPGGRISALGVYKDPVQPLDMNKVVFKGLSIRGIVGRNLWKTWDQMAFLLKNKNLNLCPVITHRMRFSQFQEAMELMKAGQAGKVVFYFD